LFYSFAHSLKHLLGQDAALDVFFPEAACLLPHVIYAIAFPATDIKTCMATATGFLINISLLSCFNLKISLNQNSFGQMTQIKNSAPLYGAYGDGES
jgi:hypothetical protein